MSQINLENRDLIIDEVKREILGPSTNGEPFDFDKDINFKEDDELYKNYIQENGQEVLQWYLPTRRYGAGILYPINLTIERSEEDELDEARIEEEIDKNPESTRKVMDEVNRSDNQAEEGDNHDIPSIDPFKQSSIGLSFLVELGDEGSIIIKVSGGRYRSKAVFQEKNGAKNVPGGYDTQ